MLPLTASRPKHLLEAAGEPFIAHQLRWLSHHGVGHAILATSYRAELFEPVLGDGRAFGLSVTYLREPEPLGTGGALVNGAVVAGLGDHEPLVAVNGDLYTRHDLGRQVHRLLAQDVDLVVHTRTVEDPRSYGSVVVDASGTVLRVEEKSTAPPGHEVNGGTYVLRRGALAHEPPGRPESFETEILPRLVATGRVVAHREQAPWLDVGTTSALVEVSRLLVTATGREAVIHPTAVVDAAARVGGGSAVGPHAHVGAGADVFGSIVMAGAAVGAHAVVRHAVVGRRAVVPAGGELRDDALGDDCTAAG